jgi:hypothetical protein
MEDWGTIPDVDVEIPQESPSIMGRIGQRAANVPSEILSDLMRLNYNLGFRTSDQPAPLDIPKPYDIPEAKTLGEAGVDIGSNIVESLPLFLSGEGAGEGAARLAGAGPILSRMMRVAGGFGVQGLTDSPEMAAEEGAMGATFGLAESVPGKWKYPAAALLGLTTALQKKAEGGSDTAATVSGVSNALLPLIAHIRRRPPAAAAEAPEAMEQLLLGYNPAARALEDVQTARPIPGTGGPISYGGELPESTTRARPIFGTEQSSVIEADFTMAPREAPTLALPEQRMTDVERRKGMGVKPPPGSLIHELPNGDSVATLQSSAPSIAEAPEAAKPSGRLLLRTVLSHETPELAEKAAQKLGLEFQGAMGTDIPGYTPHLEFRFASDAPHAAAGANISLPGGSTYAELKNKVRSKIAAFEEGKAAEIKSESKVATLQQQAEPGSAADAASTSSLEIRPEVEQVTLPQGLEVGNRAIATIEGEPIVGTINRTVEPGTVRFVEKDGTAHDLPASRIRRLGEQTLQRPRIETAGGLSELEQIAEGETASTIKFKGGGKMRKSNFGEQGSISPEAAAFMAKYIAAPTLGAFIGYAEDDQHRPGSAVIGAITAGLAAHMGGKIFRLLAAGHPEVKAAPPGTRLNALKKAIGADFVDAAKAVTGNEKMAAAAASRWGWASEYDKLARWINKNARIDIDITRMRDKAYGVTEDLSRAIGDAVKSLSRTEGIDSHFPTISDYFEGKITFATLQRKVPPEIANLAATAVQSRTALQNIISDSLGTSKLATAIKNSVGKYMTTTYRIFHDKKYMPTDDQIENAARSLEKQFPGETLETRIDHIHEYLHEVKANRALFGGSFAGAKGETLGTILTRYEGELTPEFKEMLGKYDNPLERMAFTAMKLVNGGKSAEFFNEVARGEKANGLKFAYTAEERQAAIATLQHESRYGYDPQARAAAAAKMEELKGYVYNPSGASNGKLSGKWMDVKTRDQLANYDAATRLFKSPLARAMAEATNMIKYGKIILSPLQFTRQVIQLPILGMIARTFPQDWANAYRVLNDESVAGRAEYSRLRRMGILSGDPVGGMLRRDMRAMLDGTLDALLNDRLKEGLHKWEEIWRTPDLMIRVSAFLKKEKELLDQGFDAKTAADRAIDHTNRYTMNYGAVPAIVAKGRQLPFVNQYLSWTYETMRITKNLMEDARKGDAYAIGVLSTIATAPFIIQQMSESQLSEKDRDEWNKVKNLGPAYNRQNFRFVQGRLPNGDFRYIDFTPLVIHDQFMRMMRGIMSGDTDAVKAANPFFGWENTPLLNVASILISGRNRYTGDKLMGIADTADAIRKEVLPTLAGTELDRIQRALTPTEEGGLGTMNLRTGQINSISDILQTYLTSMRPYTLRPAYVRQQAVADARDQIRSQQLVLRRTMASNASKEVKENARKSFDDSLKQILLSFHDRLGITEISPGTVNQ